jgi:hypothetical protein
MGGCYWFNLGRFTLYVRHVSVSRFSSVINALNAKLYPICHLLALLGAHPILHVSRITVKRRCSHWQKRLRQVSVPFRLRCWARMFDVTERVRTCLYLLDSDNGNSLTSPPLHFDCLLATSAACFCLQIFLFIYFISQNAAICPRTFSSNVGGEW